MGPLNNIAVFLRESHQRMGVWEEVADTHLKRLTVIGQTRWWAKDVALTKIFGAFGVPDNCAYVSVVLTLTAISDNTHMASTVRTKAKDYVESLLKYETILTAHIFLRIFEQTSALSKYLQTSGMNLVTAHRLVTGTQDNLRKYARDFESVQRTVRWMLKMHCHAEDQERRRECLMRWLRMKPLVTATQIIKTGS